MQQKTAVEDRWRDGWRGNTLEKHILLCAKSAAEKDLICFQMMFVHSSIVNSPVNWCHQVQVQASQMTAGLVVLYSSATSPDYFLPSADGSMVLVSLRSLSRQNFPNLQIKNKQGKIQFGEESGNILRTFS